MTFRVEEEEGEEEVLEVLEEEPINSSTGEGVNPHTVRNIETGMPVRQQAPAEEIEARIGRGAEEIIMRVEGTIEETTVKMPAEEITVQRGKAEETIVQDTDRRRVGPGVEETTHLKRAEGTLAKTDEGVAKGPLVMEGP